MAFKKRRIEQLLLGLKRHIYMFAIKFVLVFFQGIAPLVKRKCLLKMFAVLKVFTQSKTEMYSIIFRRGSGRFIVPHLPALIR